MATENRPDADIDHGTERNRKRWEALTPEQREAVRRMKARRDPVADENAAKFEELDAPKAPVPPYVASFCAALKAERERLGLSLADVARLSGIERSFVSRIENGKVANPTVGTLNAFADALGMTFTLGVAPKSAQ